MDLQRNCDDITLGYEEADAGGPPLLFIHGWGTQRGLFAPLLRVTSGAHRAVAVDLRRAVVGDDHRRPRRRLLLGGAR